MERFTERCKHGWYVTRATYYDTVDKLGELEDAEEQGLLLRLPCKEGTTVWGLIRFSGGGRVPSWYELCEYNFTLPMLKEIGKTVFLTREDAELALAEKEKAR